MAKKIVDETLKFNIVINGDSAKKEYGQLERQNKKLLSQRVDLENEAKRLKKAEGELSDAYLKAVADLDANSNAIDENENKMAELTKEIGINNLSMRQLRKEAGRLNGIMSNLDPETDEWEEYNKELLSVKGRQANLREEMKATEVSMEDQEKALGQLSIGFSQLFSGIKSGSYTDVADGLRTITSGLQSARTAAVAFIGTPVGIFLTALAGIGYVAKQWFNYNNTIQDSIVLTEQITRAQGEQADVIRNRAAAISNTFNADFAELLRTANGLAERLNISVVDALNEIENGYIKGANAGGDYLDQLDEQAARLIKGGASLKDVVTIIEQSQGVFRNDKFIDALGESVVALEEFTDAQRDALANAFGNDFATEIYEGLNNGSLTALDALTKIEEKTHEVQLTTSQWGTISADVFKGVGEDIGGAEYILDKYTEAIAKNERALTPLEQGTRNLADANRELTEAQDQALKSDNYIAFSRELEIFWAKTKTQFYNAVSFITDSFTSVRDKVTVVITSVIVTANQLPQILFTGVKNVATGVLQTIKTLSGLGDVLNNLIKLDFDAAEASYNNFKSGFSNAFNQVKEDASSTVKNIVTTQLAAAKAVQAQLDQNRAANIAAAKLANSLENPNNNSGSNTNQNNTGANLPDADAKQKAFLEAETQLNTFIEKQRAQRELNAKQGLDRQIADIEAKYKTELEKAVGHADQLKAIQELKDQEIADAKVESKKQELERIKAIEEANALEKETQAYDKQIADAETDEEKTQILLEKTQAIANAQIDIEEQKALEILRINQASAEEIEAVKAKFDLQRQRANTEFIKGKEAADNKALANEKTLNAQRVQEYANMFGSIAQLLGKNTAAGKAAAIAQATMNTYQGITNVWSEKSETGLVGAGLVQRLATTAIVLANGMAAVKEITKTPVKTRGYEEGLYPVTRQQDGKQYQARITTNTGTQIVNDPTVLVGERPEMVIDPDTFKKMDPQVVDYILRLAGQPVTGLESGKYPTPTEAAIPDQTNNTDSGTSELQQMVSQNTAAILQLLAEIEGGITIIYTLDDEKQRRKLAAKLDDTINASK